MAGRLNNLKLIEIKVDNTSERLQIQADFLLLIDFYR
jgi:hypothetical protein